MTCSHQRAGEEFDASRGGWRLGMDSVYPMSLAWEYLQPLLQPTPRQRAESARQIEAGHGGGARRAQGARRAYDRRPTGVQSTGIFDAAAPPARPARGAAAPAAPFGLPPRGVRSPPSLLRIPGSVSWPWAVEFTHSRNFDKQYFCGSEQAQPGRWAGERSSRPTLRAGARVPRPSRPVH